MAYTKTNWVNDEPPDIDADNLNKMEQGIYDAQFPDGGTEGQILARTANGRGWVDPPNSAVWGGITGDIGDQTDLQALFSTKMTTPSGGTTGQVLTKTASGYDWQTGGSGGTWGTITGTLSDQTDLQNALNAKANASNLATIESSTTASRAYSAGEDYLVLNGQLYDVIADIAIGETLTVGTNISATTAGDELSSLKNGLADIRFIATQVAASSSTTIAAGSTTPMSIPVTMSGWQPLGIVGYDIQSGWLIPINMSIGANGNATVWVRNSSTSSVTVTPSVIVLYKKIV